MSGLFAKCNGREKEHGGIVFLDLPCINCQRLIKASEKRIEDFRVPPEYPCPMRQPIDHGAARP